ncbi:MAG: C_GCAxxG_C_C family protein [Phycisphaerae bacterium]|nr:C_GCAxxG_C_C family protein [Phycisphaerae bacterium]
MKHTQKAVQLFGAGLNCAQAVLAAFAEELGMDTPTALKVASGFGGGIGRTGQVCGALTGAVMVLGLKYGCGQAMDKTAKYELYRKVQKLTEEFKLRTGSLYCRDLLGFDFLTPQGQMMAAQPGAFEQCDGFVHTAAELAEEMLQADESCSA